MNICRPILRILLTAVLANWMLSQTKTNKKIKNKIDDILSNSHNIVFRAIHIGLLGLTRQSVTTITSNDKSIIEIKRKYLEENMQNY